MNIEINPYNVADVHKYVNNIMKNKCKNKFKFNPKNSSLIKNDKIK